MVIVDGDVRQPAELQEFHEDMTAMSENALGFLLARHVLVRVILATEPAQHHVISLTQTVKCDLHKRQRTMLAYVITQRYLPPDTGECALQ